MTERGAPLGEVREERERGEVAIEHIVDTGTLHLDDDRLTRAQTRPIRLTDGRGRQRLPVEFEEDLLDVGTELGLEHESHVVDGRGRDAILQRRELGADLGRQEVDASRRDLTELDVHTAGFLEHTTDAHARAVERLAGAAPAGEERSETLAPGEVQQLAVAAQHRDPSLHGAHRTGRDDQACVFADRERTGTREQVERHGNRHGGGDPDGEGVEDEILLTPLPVREVEREQRSEAPSDDPGEQGPPPPASDAEQP